MRVLFALFLALAFALTVSVSAQGTTGPNFYVTGVEGTTGATFKYLFSINGAPVANPSFNLIVGTTYKFILNATLTNHPFGFSTTGDATINIEDFTSPARGGVTSSGNCTIASNTYVTADITNPCIVSITPPNNSTGLSIYYRCSRHSGMVGTLTAVAAGGSGTTSTPTTPSTSNGTTSTPTTTTAPTTTPKPTGSSSTGKNGAVVILPGAAALFIAAINALFSA